MTFVPESRLDLRFSAPDARPTPWATTVELLTDSELYWLTTVRADGRPHVVPLVGLWMDGGFIFNTQAVEQKYRNLESSDRVAVTTGQNSWAAGTDVVVEGSAGRMSGRAALERVASGLADKYGQVMAMEADDETLDPRGRRDVVFRVEPAKIIAFAKNPHGQTTYRL